MHIAVTKTDFRLGEFCVAVGTLESISPRLDAFVKETEQAARPKELLFCNLDDYSDLGRSHGFADCAACVHDYPHEKVVYLRLLQNDETIVAHELGHICVAESKAEAWSLADLGFTGEWMPPALEQFLSRTANLITDVAANKRAHVRGFDMRPLLRLQLRCHVEDCYTLDLNTYPSRLDIIHRAGQLAATSIFQEFCPLTPEENACLRIVCDYYDRWHPEIRDLARQARDGIREHGYEKRDDVVQSVKCVLRLFTDALALPSPTGPDARKLRPPVGYDPEAFCIPEEVRAGERANPYVLIRPFINVHLQHKVAVAEKAQNWFIQAFLKGAESEKLCCLAAQDFRRGRIEEAQIKVVAALREDRMHPAACHLLGRISKARGRLDDAKDCFLAALETPTKFQRAYEDFAATAFEAGDYEYAVGKLTFLLRERPALWRNARVHEYLGRSFLALGDGKNAARAFKNVLQLEPENRTVLPLLESAEKRPDHRISQESIWLGKGDDHADGR